MLRMRQAELPDVSALAQLAPIRRVFRIGVIEVGDGYVRLYNRTSDRTVTLTPEQEARWRDWIANCDAAGVRMHRNERLEVPLA